MIFTQRADYSFQYASPGIAALNRCGLLKIGGVSPKKFWQVVHEADVEELRHQCKLAAQRPEGVSTTFRVRHLQTGQITYLLEHRQSHHGGRSGLILSYEGVWLDIYPADHRRKAPLQRRVEGIPWQPSRFGLAHDFGNIMSGILSLSELFLAQAGHEHPFL